MLCRFLKRELSYAINVDYISVTVVGILKHFIFWYPIYYIIFRFFTFISSFLTFTSSLIWFIGMSSWITSLDALVNLLSRDINSKESCDFKIQEIQRNNHDLNPIYFLTTGIFSYLLYSAFYFCAKSNFIVWDKLLCCVLEKNYSIQMLLLKYLKQPFLFISNSFATSVCRSIHSVSSA